jgi:hypothetical protein
MISIISIIIVLTLIALGIGAIALIVYFMHRKNKED